MTDLLVVPGGILPNEDAVQLRKQGVTAGFQPGASLEEIAGAIRPSVTRTAGIEGRPPAWKTLEYGLT
jgi:methylmalonyl-CoA mutase C-terminal domain/subunit